MVLCLCKDVNTLNVYSWWTGYRNYLSEIFIKTNFFQWKNNVISLAPPTLYLPFIWVQLTVLAVQLGKCYSSLGLSLLILTKEESLVTLDHFGYPLQLFCQSQSDHTDHMTIYVQWHHANCKTAGLELSSWASLASSRERTFNLTTIGPRMLVLLCRLIQLILT